MGHFLISSLKSWFFADTSPGVVRRIRAEVVALDDDVGWASDEDKIEREFASSVVVGGKKEHESLDCGHVVVLTVDAASGAVVSVEKIVEAPSEQVPVEDGRSPFICEVGETIFECYCVVTRVVGGKNLGDVVVDVDGGKRFSFQLRTCRGDFRPKRDDELTVKWEIKEDGREVPISFKAARVEEWREACVVKEARFGDRNYNRWPELGALRYRNKEATFDAHVVKGCEFLPRCDEVVYASVIGTRDRIRPWRAIDVKTRTLGLQAGALNVEPKGLFVQEELDFGYVNQDQHVERHICIRNDSKQVFTLRCASFEDPVAREIFELTPNRFPAGIAPGTTLHLTLACNRAGCDDIPASDMLPFHFRFAGDVSVHRMVHAMFPSKGPHSNASRKWAFEPYERVKQLLFPVKELELKPVMRVVDEGLLRPYRRPDHIVLAQGDSYPMFLVEEEATNVFKLRWFNADLNENQRQAVKYIVSSESRIPYLIFGPPGTGKTVTVVEAVMQVFHMDPSSRIMVATPSNSAADLICSLLGHYVEKGWLEKTRLVRFDSSDECMKRIAETRIMVATWDMCSSLHQKSMRSNFFSHVFVDSAEHLTEPECLVPMTLCAAKRVILAGDPEQLGPVVSELFGMSESMLERLMRGNQAYQRDSSKNPQYGGYDPMVITKLVGNYRSHPKILELYSNLCYAGDVVPRVPDDGVPFWVPDLLKNRYPLLVVGIPGGVRQLKNSSPFNELELFFVHLYAVMLTGRGISARDVGIVTPYRRQAQKVREKLHEADLDEVKVGTVEEFEGLERRVIIVSTVDTVKTAEGKRQWSDDGFSANSFFSSKRRTNVAISRAQDFLVVIGDVELMTKDEHWGQIVSKARDGGDKHFLLVGQRPS